MISLNMIHFYALNDKYLLYQKQCRTGMVNKSVYRRHVTWSLHVCDSHPSASNCAFFIIYDLWMFYRCLRPHLEAVKEPHNIRGKFNPWPPLELQNISNYYRYDYSLCNIWERWLITFMWQAFVCWMHCLFIQIWPIKWGCTIFSPAPL